MKILKSLKIILLVLILLLPVLVFAQNEVGDYSFKAEVVEIIKEQETELPDGIVAEQQNLKLEAISGPIEGEQVVFEGIGNFDVVKKGLYELGDRVVVFANFNAEGEVNYYISDYVRSGSLMWLFVLFVFVMIAVGRWKGLRAIVSLALSFFVIVYYIVPQILDGADPVIVTVIGSLAILLVVIYLTEGLSKKSHVASLSLFISLLVTIALSWLFVELARLSGLGSEEISFLVNLDTAQINFQGLLLAGIIIGTLGVLDDVIISQVATVDEIYKTDPLRRSREVFVASYNVGVSHISSMANTLFLAYAGASLPLLVLFVSGEGAFSDFGDVINNEVIATEIVRTLAGSTGLVMAVPLSTWLAVVFLKPKA